MKKIITLFLFSIFTLTNISIFSTHAFTNDQCEYFYHNVEIDDNYVYASCFDNTVNPSQSNIRAYDKATGSLQFQTPVREGTIFNFAVDDNYIYAGINNTGTIEVYDKLTGVYQFNSDPYGGIIRAVEVDATQIYVAGDEGFVKVYNKSDGSLQFQTSNYGVQILDITVDNTSIYAAGNTGTGNPSIVEVYNKVNGNYDYSTDIYPDGNLSAVKVDENYIYTGGGFPTRTVEIYEKGTGNFVKSTAQLNSYVSHIQVDDNYLYIGHGGTNGELITFNKNTLTLLDLSPTYNDYMRGLVIDSTHAYFGIGSNIEKYELFTGGIPPINTVVNSPYFHYNTQDLSTTIQSLEETDVTIILYRLGENGLRQQTLDSKTVNIDSPYTYNYNFPLNADYPYELVVNGETVRKGYTTPPAHGSFYDRMPNIALGNVARNPRGVIYQHDPYNLNQPVYRYGSNIKLHFNFDTVVNNEYIRLRNAITQSVHPMRIYFSDIEEHIGFDSDFIILPTNGKMPNYIDDNLVDYYRNFTQDYNYSYDYTVTITEEATPVQISEPGAFENTNGLKNATIYMDGVKVVENGVSLIGIRYQGDIFGYDYVYESGDIRFNVTFIETAENIGGIDYIPGDIFIGEVTASTSPEYPIDIRVVLNPEPINIPNNVYIYEIVEDPISIFSQKGESILVISDYDYLFKIDLLRDTITRERRQSVTLRIPDINIRNAYRNVILVNGFTNTNYGDEYDRSNVINTFTWDARDPLNLGTSEVSLRFNSSFYNLTEYRFAFEQEYTVIDAVPLNERVNTYFDLTGLGAVGKILIMIGIFIFFAVLTMILKAPKWATILVLAVLFILFTVFGLIPIWFILVLTMAILIIGYMIYSR